MKKTKTITTPTLKSKTLGKHAIEWIWDHRSDCCSYLVDEFDTPIKQLGYGINTYIESDLMPGQVVKRKVILYHESASSLPSQLVSASTLVTEQVISVANTLTPKVDKQAYEVETIQTQPLPAFQSGVGYGNDLKIEKQLDQTFNEYFNILATVSGIYRQQAKYYDPVTFHYRIKATGIQHGQTSVGEVKIKVSAHKKEDVTFTIQRYATQPVQIKARVKFKVEYYEKVNGVFRPHQKTMYSAPITHSFDQSGRVLYDQATGIVSLNPKPREAISTLTLRQLADAAIANDPVVNASRQQFGVTIYAYELEDDYAFDVGDSSLAYGKTKPRPFSASGLGSVRVVANTNPDGTLNEESNIYMEGFANAGLFVGDQTFTKTLSQYQGETFTVLTKAEVEKITLKNIDDSTFTYTGALGGVTNVIRHLVHSDNIVITDHGFGATNILTAKMNVLVSTQTLTYRFNDKNTFTDVSYYQMIQGLDSDPLSHYSFETKVLACTSNIYINGKKVSVGSTELEEGSALRTIKLSSSLKETVSDWSMTLPNPDDSLPFSATVNGGRIDVNDGKQDHEVYTPRFLIPPTVTDVTFEVIYEGNQDELTQAPIRARFEGENPSSIGTVNGGLLTFSCDMYSYGERELTSFVTKKRYEGFKIDGVSEKSFYITLTKENTGHSYDKYLLSLASDNNSVAILRHPEEISFTNGECVAQVTARIQPNAIARWSPRIHSGYYYLNQNEYYLPAEFKAEADYESTASFETMTFSVGAEVVLSRSTARQPFEMVLSSESDYRVNSSKYDLYAYRRDEQAPIVHQITVQPVVESDHYKQYQDISYLTPVKSFDEVVQVWDSISWKEDKTENCDMSVSARVYDAVLNRWTDWIELISNGKPLLPASSLIQFKVEGIFEQESSVQDMTILSNCKTDFESLMSTTDSVNIAFTKEGIVSLNMGLESTYVTNIIDYGVSVDLGFNVYASDNRVQTYIAASNDQHALMTNPNWLPCSSTFNMKSCRFARYKIIIPAEQAVYRFTRSIKTEVLTDAHLAFGDFTIQGKYRASSSSDIVTKVFECHLTKDGQAHQILSSLGQLLQADIQAAGYTLSDVYQFTLQTGLDDVLLSYTSSDIRTVVYATSLGVEVVSDKLSKVKFKNNRTVIQAIPQQFSPILVQHDKLGVFKEVEFLTETGEPTLDYHQQASLKESFYLKLDHLMVDEQTLTVQLNGETLSYRYQSGVIYFDEPVTGVVNVCYRLINSFMVHYDFNKQTTEIILHAKETVSSAYVSFETSLITSYKNLDFLSLNPIYNTLSSGFIYLTYEQYEPRQVTASATTTVFKPRVTDHTNVFVQVTDHFGNPVIDEPITVAQSIGRLEQINPVTDMNGIAVFRYHSPRGVGGETLLFTTKNGLMASLDMTVKSPY